MLLGCSHRFFMQSQTLYVRELDAPCVRDIPSSARKQPQLFVNPKRSEAPITTLVFPH
jgi:hypothetical protein